MKKYFSTFFALFCFFVLVVCLGVSAVDSASSVSVYSEVLRLHVVANSDFRYDQELKYKVRDEIVTLTENMFSECRTVDEALCIANENKSLFKETAKRVLEDNGSGQTANVAIGKAYYPEKTYGGIVFPEGEYLSVRIVLGNGEGQNWWCVLFPSLCDVGVEQEGTAVASGGLDKARAQSITDKENSGGVEIFGCRVKLKILEYFK